jgi:hypothetical protein
MRTSVLEISGVRAWRRLGLALWLAFAQAPAAVAQPTDLDTVTIMLEFVAALQTALPPSLSADKFADPERRSEIMDALERLAATGERLDDHGKNNEASFAFLSRSLARDTRDILTRYANGRYGEARFLLQHVTEVCVACHARLPDTQVRPFGVGLMATDAVAALPPTERAEFEMATRQFDAALASYEAVFSDPDLSPADVDLMGHFDSYLELCLRVQHDPQHALMTLQKITSRPDVPERVRENANAWIASLTELRSTPLTGTPLDRARELLARAGDRERFPDERRALVQYIAASGVLHRYVVSQVSATPDLGEAYYLLGVIEATVGRSFWASQTEHYLETSIRIGPGEAYAEEAYDLLEEFIVAGHTGSAGAHIPQEVRRRLGELRELIDAAQDS